MALNDYCGHGRAITLAGHSAVIKEGVIACQLVLSTSGSREELVSPDPNLPTLSAAEKTTLFGYVNIRREERTAWLQDPRNYEFTENAYILGKQFKVSNSIYVQCRNGGQRGRYYAEILYFISLRKLPGAPSCCIIRIFPHSDHVYNGGDEDVEVLDSDFAVHLIDTGDDGSAAAGSRVAIIPVSDIWSACIMTPYKPVRGHSVILPIRREL